MVCFLFFCNFAPALPPPGVYDGTAPYGVYSAAPGMYDFSAAPDGMGGFVPFTNSRVLPDGSLRPYDPALDGPFQ